LPKWATGDCAWIATNASFRCVRLGNKVGGLSAEG
jgi:hypothetical protein